MPFPDAVMDAVQAALAGATGVRIELPPLPPPPAEQEPVDPSVASFVPMLPKCIAEKQLQLVVLPHTPQLLLQLALPAAPAVSSDALKQARECRRFHVSGFPQSTTKRDLEIYFDRDVLPGRRRSMVLEQTKNEIKESVLVNIDRVVDIFLDSTKAHPFAFVEVNFDDMAGELVEKGESDLFSFPGFDGRSYPLRIRRPNNFRNQTHVDFTKMVVLGVPPGEENRLRYTVLSMHGEVKNFQAVDGLVYCEFDDRGPVDSCIDELNGWVWANRLIVVRPLSECLRASCFTAGIKLSPPTHVATQEAAAPATERDLYKETMDLATPLHKVLSGLPALHSHLRPLFGTAIPVFPTTILVLLNAIDEDELPMDEDFSALQAALAEELEQYGRVKQLIVPRRTAAPVPPKPFLPKKIDPPARDVGLLTYVNPFDGSVVATESDAAVPVSEREAYEQAVREQEAGLAAYEEAKDAFRRLSDQYHADIRHPVHGGYGKAFAEYETVDEAAYAQRCISGKLFSGRTVVTSFMFDDVLHPPAEGAAAEDEPAAAPDAAPQEAEAPAPSTGAPEVPGAEAAAPAAPAAPTDDID